MSLSAIVVKGRLAKLIREKAEKQDLDPKDRIREYIEVAEELLQ